MTWGMADAMAKPSLHADSYEAVPTSYSQRARLRVAYGADRWLRPASGMALRIAAPVDEHLLAAALTAVARRHSALRTFFPRHLAEDHAACVRPKHTNWPLSVFDECTIGPSPASRLDSLFVPFSPEEPPLLRAGLLRSGKREHVLGLAIDHLNFDGESVAVLTQDLAAVWRLMSQGAGMPELSAAEFSYARFVRWQEDWVGQMGEEAIAYWAPRWGPAGLYPELPFPDPAEMDGIYTRSNTWEYPIDQASLERRGRQLDAGQFTEFMLVAAALLRVMNRRFGLTEPGLLFPYSNRVMKDSAKAIGYFNNRLVLRPSLSTRASFKEVADAVRMSLIEALHYGSLPYNLIGERLFPEEIGRRPANKFLYLNMGKLGKEYPVPGGAVTEMLLDVDRDMGTDPGMFITYLADQATGSARLRCTYGALFYAAKDVDQFMTEVLANLQPDW